VFFLYFYISVSIDASSFFLMHALSPVSSYNYRLQQERRWTDKESRQQTADSRQQTADSRQQTAETRTSEALQPLPNTPLHPLYQ
jgi:hypothetical protein